MTIYDRMVRLQRYGVDWPDVGVPAEEQQRQADALLATLPAPQPRSGLLGALWPARTDVIALATQRLLALLQLHGPCVFSRRPGAPIPGFIDRLVKTVVADLDRPALVEIFSRLSAHCSSHYLPSEARLIMKDLDYRFSGVSGWQA